MGKNEMKYKVNDEYVTVEIGKQNFGNMTVEVNTVGGEKHQCDMFQEADGDIGFTYKGEPVWFHHCIQG